MKKNIFHIAIASLILALFISVSCSGRIVRDPSVLVTDLPMGPLTFNPVLLKDADSWEVNTYIFESLLKRDNTTLEFIPNLANSYEISPDHLVYTFHLRKDVKWNDGTQMTAEDVIYTFERMRDPKVDAPNRRHYLKDISSMEKLDDYTVRFVYTKPYFRALDIIGGLLIIPKHVFDDGHDFNKHPANFKPVGTGPYKLSEWKASRYAKLVRNENYWGEKPAISGIVINTVSNSMVAFQLLKKGAADFGRMRAIQWARQTNSKSFSENFTKHKYYQPNFSYIAWNMRTPYFEDKRVRLAMGMFLNRDAILKEILFNQGEMVESPFYKFGSQYDESLKPVSYDPKEARHLLSDAGWADTDGDGVLDKNGVAFEFNFVVSAESLFTKSIGLMLKEELAKAGITMEIRQIEAATMMKLKAERKFDAMLGAWGLPLEHDPYEIWHSSQIAEGSNITGFADERVDKIIEDARSEFDETKRNKLYKEFQKIIYEEQPYTFLYTLPNLVAITKRFENVIDYRVGPDMLEWKIGPWPVLIEW